MNDRPCAAAPRTAGTRGAVAGLALGLVAVAAGVGLLLVPATGERTAAGDKPTPDHQEPWGAPGTDDARPSAAFESADNPLYALTPPEGAPCELPGLDPYSTAAWEEFAPAAVECMDGLWRPLLEELGLDPPTPAVQFDGAHEEEWTGLYRDNTIVIFLDAVSADAPGVPDDRQEAVWLSLMAHEYGHYLQDHARILTHAMALKNDAGQAEALELQRRGELQAECFAGVSMRAAASYSEDEMRAVNNVRFGRQSSPTHGEVGNRKRWFLLGWHARTLEDCNTFAAAPELVR